ncbi:RNA binding protein 26 [Trichuris trichiura]|uniref:RNA binding protein 26 n=1 Tax=Trichuris trichiura TaxID=36087 RepID=A0A077ZGJ3_TRITR|nr:RNA binding protein 26 [Trichuris trichiura]
MLVAHPELLREWICANLSPICDADPSALAKYVIALLKKEKHDDELVSFLSEQLEVFLQKNTLFFVEKLISAVKDKTYLKSSKRPSSSSSKEFSRSARDSSEGSSRQSRSEHQNSEKNDSVPRRRKSSPNRPKTFRKTGSRSRSRSRERNKGTSSGSAGSRSSLTSSREREKENRDAKGVQSPLNAGKEPRKSAEQDTSTDVTTSVDSTSNRGDKDKRKKLRCRDFDGITVAICIFGILVNYFLAEKGYCMLGDNCPFDHGPDPVVVEEFPLPNMMPHKCSFFFPLPMRGSTVCFVDSDPEMATRPVKPTVVAPPPPNFSIPPPGYAPIQPPTAVESKYQPEAYNPESPSLTSAPPVKGAVAMPAYSQPPPILWSQPPPPTVLRFGPMHPFSMEQSVKMGVGQQSTEGVHVKPMGAGGLRMPGTQGSSYGSRKRPVRSDIQAMPYGKFNRTLEVRRIPVPLNTISKLNGHFSTFGNVTNINVRYASASRVLIVGFDSDPQGALITYATRGEAVAAYKSTTPIFNNRFIKVFWHKSETTDSDKQEERVVKSVADESAKDLQVTKPSKNGMTADEKPEVNNSQKNDGVGVQPSAKYVKTSDGFALARRNAAAPTDKEAEKPVRLICINAFFLFLTSFSALQKCDRSVELQRTNLELFNNYMEQQKFLFARLETCDDAEIKKQLLEVSRFNVHP